MRLQQLGSFVRKDAVRPPAISDDLTVARQLAQPLLQLFNGNRACIRNVDLEVLQCWTNVQQRHITQVVKRIIE